MERATYATRSFDSSCQTILPAAFVLPVQSAAGSRELARFNRDPATVSSIVLIDADPVLRAGRRTLRRTRLAR
jgi:hypothetical protein